MHFARIAYQTVVLIMLFIDVSGSNCPTGHILDTGLVQIAVTTPEMDYGVGIKDEFFWVTSADRLRCQLP